MSDQGFSRPGGDIITLLDLTPRDFQDGEFTPLNSEKTWWLPDEQRRLRPFSLSVQTFPFRGPTAFGQRFTFDIGSVSAGDLLFSTSLQIELGHWLDDTSLLRLESGQYTYPVGANPWYYANSLGSVIIEKAELEINEQIVESVDGDFLNVTANLFLSPNSQYGLAADGLGQVALSSLGNTPASRPFPTLSRSLFIPLPFFFQRTRLQEAFPLLACREGSVRINVTLRPFLECIRLLNGRRTSCQESPLGNQIIQLYNNANPNNPLTQAITPIHAPSFSQIQLITYAAHTDGLIRQRILRDPFEIMYRNVQTFTFDEPLKYLTNKSGADIIQVQLPLETNHPMEEIIWFVRRKAAANNNEWTNYSATMSPEYDAVFNPSRPLLKNAIIQMNGTELVNAEEQWFRQHISILHKGGASAYNSYIYGYSFSKNPGEHQPSGTANASRLQSLRLTLDVGVPGGTFEQDWEVKVFVINLQWLRFQGGLANKMYQD